MLLYFCNPPKVEREEAVACYIYLMNMMLLIVYILNLLLIMKVLMKSLVFRERNQSKSLLWLLQRGIKASHFARPLQPRPPCYLAPHCC